MHLTMQRIAALLALLLAALFTLAPTASADGPARRAPVGVTVPNPGAENADPFDPTLPQGWRRSVGPGNAAIRDTSPGVAWAGQAAFKLSASAGNINDAGFVSSSFPLPQPFTEQARLTLYARADVPATALTYALTARDAQGRYAGYACGVFMASASYAMYSAPLGYFSPAATSASLELRANVSGAQGGRSVWVDEIRLEPQPYTK